MLYFIVCLPHSQFHILGFNQHISCSTVFSIEIKSVSEWMCEVQIQVFKGQLYTKILFILVFDL